MSGKEGEGQVVMSWLCMLGILDFILKGVKGCFKRRYSLIRFVIL